VLRLPAHQRIEQVIASVIVLFERRQHFLFDCIGQRGDGAAVMLASRGLGLIMNGAAGRLQYNAVLFRNGDERSYPGTVCAGAVYTSS